VTLTVSSGAPQVAVPDVRNLTIDDAKAASAGNFDVLQVAEEPSDDVEAGRITNQDPAAGEKAAKGSQLKVTVSSGRKRGTMPGVVGQKLSAARAQLGALGVTVVVTPSDLEGEDNASVVQQAPVAGELISPGQTVTLTLAPPATTTTSTPPTTAAPSK
jgi:serine/threonine-protein kinase